jgi:carboxypeptidase family protein
MISKDRGKRPVSPRFSPVFLGFPGSAAFTAKTDNQGTFTFWQVSKGDYTLRAVAPGYTTEERQIRVTGEDGNSCKQPKIEVRLGFRSCDGGIYIKGVDKKSDLFREKGTA